MKIKLVKDKTKDIEKKKIIGLNDLDYKKKKKKKKGSGEKSKSRDSTMEKILETRIIFIIRFNSKSPRKSVN